MCTVKSCQISNKGNFTFISKLETVLDSNTKEIVNLFRLIINECHCSFTAFYIFQREVTMQVLWVWAQVSSSIVLPMLQLLHYWWFYIHLNSFSLRRHHLDSQVCTVSAVIPLVLLEIRVVTPTEDSMPLGCFVCTATVGLCDPLQF